MPVEIRELVIQAQAKEEKGQENNNSKKEKEEEKKENNCLSPAEKTAIKNDLREDLMAFFSEEFMHQRR